MRRFRHAKIIATLGPSSSSDEMIESLFLAGADVFRLNFSHGTQADHRARLDSIRALARRIKRPIGILADLQGPKLRVGTFADGKVALSAGQTFRLDLLDAPGSPERVCLPHPEIFSALVPGTDLLLDDGRIRLTVIHIGPEFAETEVATGGTLSDRKGVNVPGVQLAISPLTPKDRADLAFALDMGVDWVALSFVQRAEDVAEIRKIVDGTAGIIAKLEKPSALEHLDAIIELSDAVMVARGDLGVEIPPERVPIAQKRIISTCRAAGKPVIVATQMLESMITAPAPTRAEASDVATAIYDG
ncbi:MAG: pyruvate kinase, partial [Rhodospirillaceae bacterium]|nr:pyruvate kinase [Rhodospirillaceae bacterium]